MKWAFLVALVYGVTLVVSDDLDLDLPDVETSNFPKIPGFENINTSALPSKEKLEEVFRKKCELVGGPDAYRIAKGARGEMEKCVRSLIDFEQLTKEMEVAKPTGDLDEVFRTYCRKSPAFKECVMGFVNASNQCMTEAEQGSRPIVQNVTDQLLGFVCYKEGDRIALFIAEKGPECLSDKKEAIIHCVNATFGKHISGATPDVYDLPRLLMGTEECKDVCALRRCVVKELENCSEPTPANIIQSMFDFVLKSTPCSHCKADQLNSHASSSSSRIPLDYFSFVLSLLFVFTLH